MYPLKATFINNNSADINECQTKYGKTILLSLGGATTDERGFIDSASAKKAARMIWSSFGPEIAVDKGPRPFGSASIDGFDFDFEHAIPNLPPFANELRKLMDTYSHKTSKRYLLTAAPQCYWPDAANGPMLDGKVYFDAIFVQFYNNGCGLQNFTYGSESQRAFNFELWDKWAKTTSKNPAVKILLGVPAAETAAGSGFKDGSDLDRIIEYSQKFDSFGGVMMWDVNQAYSNPGFIDRVSLSLGRAPSSGVVPLANNTVTPRPTTKSSSLITISITPTTTLSFTFSPKPTPAIYGSLQTLPYTNSTLPAAAQPIISSEEANASPEPADTANNMNNIVPASQSDIAKPPVNPWNQCGGKDWNGGTQCKEGARCKFLGEWYSHCVPDDVW